MRLRRRPRRCPCCRTDFVPDPFNRHRQKFCCRTEDCRKASRRASSARHRRRRGADASFRRSEVERVRGWRSRTPGYWRLGEKRSGKMIALRDSARGGTGGDIRALRDFAFFQQTCLQGLVSHLTGALRDDIGSVMNGLYDRGVALSKEGRATFNMEDSGHETEGDRGPGPPQARA
jgi:hypothetical protein